jgi:hypothetical protein
VRSFWQRWRDPLNLHGKLEARRSRARPEFVRQLADELGGQQSAPARLRHAFAVALTLLMLVAAGILGGTGHVASAAVVLSDAVTGITGGNDQGVFVSNNDDDDGGRADDDDDDPDDDQYEEDERECELAIAQAHAQFHASGASGHLAFHRWLRIAERECDAIGGGGDDDDD